MGILRHTRHGGKGTWPFNNCPDYRHGEDNEATCNFKSHSKCLEAKSIVSWQAFARRHSSTVDLKRPLCTTSFSVASIMKT